MTPPPFRLTRHLRADRTSGDCLPPKRRYLILTIRPDAQAGWARLRVCDHDDGECEITAPIRKIQRVYRQICAARRVSLLDVTMFMAMEVA